MTSKNIEIQLAWINLKLLKAGSLTVESVILQSNQMFNGLSFPVREWNESKPEYVATFITFLQRWIESHNHSEISTQLDEFERLINMQ